MKLIRSLAGALVSSALLSSSVTMAFPMSKSVREYFEGRKYEAKKSERGFRFYILKKCPFLDCVNSNEIDDNFSLDSLYGGASECDFGEMPIEYEILDDLPGFRLLRFEGKDLEKPMVFNLVKKKKNGKKIAYYVHNSKEYGKGPDDNYKRSKSNCRLFTKEIFFRF